MRAPYEFGELRLADLLAFLAVQRTQSVTAAARELSVTPSQISKAIARLEEHVHTRLLRRGARGVSLTESGARIAPAIAEAVAKLRAVRPFDGSDAPLELTVAAPSYILSVALPALAKCTPPLRLRGFELPPAEIRALLAEDCFDIGIVPGRVERLPVSWTSDHAGDMRLVLFATPETAKKLAPLPTTAEKVRQLAFIGPTYRPSGRFVAVRDDCPLPESERRIAHETHTIALALELASSTGHLVYGPAIAARHYVDRGELVEVPVVGWNVSEPATVVCDGHRVLARVRTAVVAALQAALTA